MKRFAARTATAMLLAGLASCGPSRTQPSPEVLVANEVAAAPGKGEDEPKNGGAAVGPALVSGSAFAFPADAGGKLLGVLVTPAEPPRLPAPTPRGPSERPIPDAIERPTALPRLANPAPPTVPLRAPVAARPAAVVERVPAQFASDVPDLPFRIELPPGPATRAASANPAEVLPLPPLARPVADRASLDDPSADFSAKAVTGAPLPIRSTRAAFVRVNLPDPFEYADTARLRLDAAEDPGKVLGNPTPPKR